jgi:hypothetical protein
MSGFNLPKKPKLKLREPPEPSKFCVIPSRAVGDRALTKSQLRALAALCLFANRGGFAWPSLSRVGRELGINDSATSQHFAKLKAKGYIERIAGGIQGVRGNTYRVIYDPKITTNDALALASDDDVPPVINYQRENEVARQRKAKAKQELASGQSLTSNTVNIMRETKLEPFEAWCYEMGGQRRKSESDLLGDQLIATIDWPAHAETFAAFVRTVRPSSYTKAVRAYLQAL